MTQADTLAQYFAEVHDWTMRLTGKEIDAPRSCLDLIEELGEVGVVRIEKKSKEATRRARATPRQPVRRTL